MNTRAASLIGRSMELRLLDESLANVAAGRGAAVFLLGETGIGRTRLAAEVHRRAGAAGIQVLRGRGSRIGPDAPLRAFTEALFSGLREPAPPGLTELGPYLSVLGRLVPHWRDDPATQHPGSDGTSVIVLAEAILRFAALAGRGQGCLLLLDDLQDADPQTLAVVEYLIDNLAGQPVLLICTVRDEPGAATDLAESSCRRATGTLVRLSPFNRPDLRRMAASVLGADPTAVPDSVLDRLWVDSAGNPLLAEEFLSAMVSSGTLVAEESGWQVHGPLVSRPVPASAARRVAADAGRLGPLGLQVLSAGAVIGERFPLAVARVVAGVNDHQAEQYARAAVDQRLLRMDNTGWYAFVHPFAAGVLQNRLLPKARVELARRAAEEIEARRPGLPGEWCELVAGLRLQTGDRPAAGRLLTEAGVRILQDMGPHAAVDRLERARQLLRDDPDDAARLRALEALLQALTDSGRVRQALALGAGETDGDFSAEDRARLCVRQAWSALVAGRYSLGLTHLATARTLLGQGATPAATAAIDAAEANLQLQGGTGDAFAAAETSARRALAALHDPQEATPQEGTADVACQAWYVLGTVLRGREPTEAAICFARMRRLAPDGRTSRWRVFTQLLLATEASTATEDDVPLRRVLEHADHTGAAVVRYHADAMLALHEVRAGDTTAASVRLDAALAGAEKLGLGHAVRELRVVTAVLAAHRGRGRDLEDALVRLREGGHKADHPRNAPLLHGMAGVFLALLDENRERALQQVERARAAGDAPEGGWQGMARLLAVLDGDDPGPATASALATPWNRAFALFADAIRAGRAGGAVLAQADAGRAMAAAERAAGRYPTALHLCRRLVAEAALRDGWGDPEAWLREAEDYFHGAGMSIVAGACRALLRQAGAPVRQRRSGSTRVPAPMRALGVTVREYEVLMLLAQRLGNRSIAARLHISPRTAEKHVASLITKTGVAGRDALGDVGARSVRDADSMRAVGAAVDVQYLPGEVARAG
ncbi:helix-turn-helix transcriptional regulator [Winogradskya consettensis]|nr:LuxR family transcriptional regulator [Actinoplanes consettensis]